MSNVIFNFDGNAIGLLETINTVSSAMSSLVGIAQSVASSFMSIAGQSEVVTSSWTQLAQNVGQFSSAMDDSTQKMGGSSKAAQNLQYELQRLAERASDAAKAHSDAVQQIQEQESALTATTAKEIDRRSETYNDSLAKLVRSHQEAIDSINESENNLTENYEDQINRRLLKLNDPRATQHNAMVTALEHQIDAALATGNTGVLAGLRDRLNKENATYNSYIKNTIEPYYGDLDAIGARHYQQQMDKLKDSLNKQNTAYDDQRSKLKETYDNQLTDIQTSYKKQEDSLADHLTKENTAYAKQMRDIAEQRQHALESSGGGGGGGGGGNTAPVKAPDAVTYIDLFKRLGIDPKKDPIAAANAMQTWIAGAGGASGEASTTQMTIQQVQGIVGQAWALGQDPTRAAKGKENYVDLFADLLAYTGATSPSRMDTGSRYSSLTQIMEKAMTGNTTGVMLQLQRLGLGNTKTLEHFGVKFGGAGGKTIENPENLMNALMSLAATQAPGLGAKQATNTLPGILNNAKDKWTGFVNGVMGNPEDKNSLSSKFNAQLNTLLGQVDKHAPQIAAMGKTIGENLLGAFTKLVSFLSSKQADHIFHDIARAFTALGNALHWIGEHKEIVLLLMSLLAMQVGGKLAVAGAKGVTGMAQSLLSGGPLGAVKHMLFPQATGPIVKGLTQGSLFPELTEAESNPNLFSKIWSGSQNISRGFLGGARGVPGAIRGLPDLASGTITAGAQAIRGGIGAAGDLFGSGLGGIIPKMVGGVAGSGGSLLGGISGIMPMLMGLGPALGGIALAAGPILLVVGAVAGLVAVLVMNKEKILPFIHVLQDFFGKKLAEAKKALTEFVKGVQDRLADVFSPGSPTMKFITIFAKFWAGAWGGIQLAFTGVWNIIEGAIKIAWSIISGIINIGLDLLGGKWGKAWSDIQKMLSGVWTGIQQMIGGALQVVGGIIVGFFGGLWATISKPVGAAIGKITGAFSGIGDFLGTLFTTTIPTKLASFITWAGGLAHSIAKAIVDAAPSFLQGPLKGALGSIGITGLATGGYYPGGETYLVGEHGPELFFSRNYGAVVSNDQVRSALASSGARSSGEGSPVFSFQGDLHFYGVQNVAGFYDEMNKIAGLRSQYGRRGGSIPS